MAVQNCIQCYVRLPACTDEIDNCTVSGTASSERDMQLNLDIYDAMSLLKPTERTCVALQLIDGYRIDEIAHITDMAEGTVMSHLSRVKTKLASYLRQNVYGKK